MRCSSLARSQSDPRKTVAELVQNALDANARRVTIGAIATNIGHSRKRGLPPRERHEQVVAGKYGIGLLGFWSIVHRMDIRSRVGGGVAWVLRLVEDQERAELLPDRLAFDAADTFTEVVVHEVHESAQRLLTGA